MGAQTFHQQAWNPDLQEAYNSAFGEAEDDHGRNGYTGSLAEKLSFVVIDEVQPLPAADAWDYADELLDLSDARVNDKWGPAGAIPMSRNAAEHRQVEVTVSFDPRVDPANLSGAALSSVLRTKAQELCEANERVVRASVTSRRFTTSVERSCSGEPARTAYRVGDRVYVTLADAQACVDATLARYACDMEHSDQPLPHMRSVDIEAIQVTDTGSPVISSSHIRIDGVTVHGTATLSRPVENPPIDGWLFFGWASS